MVEHTILGYDLDNQARFVFCILAQFEFDQSLTYIQRGSTHVP